MKKHRLIIVIAIAGLVMICGLGSYWVYQHQLNQPMNLSETAILLIEPGDSLTAIGNKLVRRGWIEHPYFLIHAGRSRDLAGSIKTGEYEIRPGLTPLQLLSLIVSGKVIQYSLTIPEGWTFRQIMSAVRSNQHLQHTLEGDGALATIMGKLGHPELHPEGRFFPDTYKFPAGTRDLEFLQRSYNIMEQVLAAEWQQRAPDLPYQDPYQALIMASIIEKETAVAEERYKIAGVFVRRLQRGIKLQTDPTVIYAVGIDFNGDITTSDLNLDSPYNTYRYPGLPPTPIAVPGRESIRAALQPEPGKALYFVAMDNGRHYFSETLEEHNQAVTKYQLKKP
ncbi:MAG: hypothetical protein A3J35_07610 [Gammaproteobacteria bacterium RIFCSPLOWO2_02_FULL_52_10]|nr:MAG: hypothetical protein A3J35_07610 [Gammaproteobacteria bacterium RIFCSPLOWO2_02_FULL_52_10]